MQSPSVLKTGSSPHARGAPRSGLSAAEERWDHPRMRGEHREGEYFDAAGTGIIPACAGSTPSVLEIKTASAGSSPHARGARFRTARNADSRQDHPRMRGEHRSRASSSMTTPGSSPHARGALEGDVREAVAAGIIPACAGSTRRWHRPASSWGDHPRMRGEHPLSSEYLMYLTGIIPACAGSTFPPRPRRTTRSGSSPHARGARAPCSPPAS